MCRAKGPESNIWRSRDRLVAALATFTAPRLLWVNEFGTSKQMYVWAADGAAININPGGFTFDMTLTAEDPRKYSPYVIASASQASSTTISVQQQGNFASPPFFTVAIGSGTTTSPITISAVSGGVTLGSLSIASYTKLATETVLIIDDANRTIIGKNAGATVMTNRYGSLSPASTWFDLATGATDVTFVGVGHTMFTSYRDTWI